MINYYSITRLFPLQGASRLTCTRDVYNLWATRYSLSETDVPHGKWSAGPLLSNCLTTNNASWLKMLMMSILLMTTKMVRREAVARGGH